VAYGGRGMAKKMISQEGRRRKLGNRERGMEKARIIWEVGGVKGRGEA